MSPYDRFNLLRGKNWEKSVAVGDAAFIGKGGNFSEEV
jgi:hypothetical protein